MNTTKPFNDFTPATKESADSNAIYLAIGMTMSLPNGRSSNYYAGERIKARCAALSAAFALRRICGGRG